MDIKNILWATALMACSLPAMATNNEEMVLCIYTEQGKEFVCRLSEQPRIVIDGNLLTLYTANGIESVAWDDVTDFVFGLPDGVRAPKQSVAMTVGQGRISLEGLAANSLVLVVGMNGSTAISTKAEDNGTATIDINGLGRGVWIVRTQAGSFKFAKK